MRRLDIFVDQASRVDFPERLGDRDGEAQEASDLHRRAETQVEWSAARVFEHEQGLIPFARQFERPRRPSIVQFIPQCVFVSQAVEGERGRERRRREHAEHALSRAAAIMSTARSRQLPLASFRVRTGAISAT